ncbi:hypothetical protein VCR20J5_1240354 [Vibrio crassostreae]|nr:hypothetical protein VCR20J5_1240354 [Vibrio crassostreae]
MPNSNKRLLCKTAQRKRPPTFKIRRLSNGFTADNDLRGTLYYDFQSIQYPSKQVDGSNCGTWWGRTHRYFDSIDELQPSVHANR